MMRGVTSPSSAFFPHCCKKMDHTILGYERFLVSRRDIAFVILFTACDIATANDIPLFSFVTMKSCFALSRVLLCVLLVFFAGC